MADAKLVQQLERRVIVFADEVIEPLDGHPVEIEVGGHSARLASRFEYR